MSNLEDREDWKRYRAAMQVIATRFGVPVRSVQKYSYLNVNFNTAGLSVDEAAALSVIEDLVALVSEWPEGMLERTAPVLARADDGTVRRH